ncbi:Utp18p KNAG_0B05280 [Huiozyma naganishii CBS 8797]|uniref:Anaphase-promoting complex subunit 4 WD40 domain-containing protein n=1 Tax=Huiozyma naganishii (strain ATCC MYA-139 / BCRC 22969 / CBS 8797 / KCTC 17520 / NBRC 10181 / NCYC 3082 / Yp74L-3) TaxID=1071383 RepID=J7S559_HUIN7|nr:hypothetical protein KNAG_0B05280 [Kazachstania naganishii CBS 8797]CCK68961.1 hypothetical protein KNAG_0B05280 [Kazachstania naganishii CBS 8797]
MTAVGDDQLFFVDDGEEEADADEDRMEIDVEESEDSVSEEENAWEDSDDEQLRVPITETHRTKKLRHSYTENKITGTAYIRRLRTQFEKIYPRPKWADEPDVDEKDGNASSDEEAEETGEQVVDGDVYALSKILQSTYNYKDVSGTKLLPSVSLDILRLKDANVSHPSRSAIQSLSFHPTKPLLLTGGYDKTLRIYHIDGKNNHLVTSLHLRDTPIQSCTFYVSPSESQQRIFTGGRRRYMHSWDLSNNTNNTANSVAKVEKFSRLYGHENTQRSFEKFKVGHFFNSATHQTHGIICLQGNNGWINVLNSISGLWMLGCKIEGLLVDFCIDYKPLGKGKFKTILIVANTYGEVWEFDLNNNGEVLTRWKDEGGIGITTIQVGGGTNSDHLLSTKNVRANRWLAIGSESGFVNIYERNGGSLFSGTMKPVAVMDHLTTTISSVQFSPDGQILCIGSRAVKDALRLIHLPSFTVFKNWPTSGTPFGKVTTVAFSSHGEMLAVGNEQGKVRLWRLNHY